MEAYYAEGYIGSNSCTGRYLAMNAAPDGSTVYPLREQSAQVYVDGEAKSTHLLPDGYGFQKADNNSWLTDAELAKSGSSILDDIGTVWSDECGAYDHQCG